MQKVFTKNLPVNMVSEQIVNDDSWTDKGEKILNKQISFKQITNKVKSMDSEWQISAIDYSNRNYWL